MQTEQQERVAKRLVEVAFDANARPLSYLCEFAEIAVGDLVMVEGKMEDQIGLVIKVQASFKSPKFEMRYIASVLDRDLTGVYRRVGEDVISFDSALTAEKFYTMVTGQKYVANPICGDGEIAIDLERFESAELFESPLTLHLGKEYFLQGNVAYLTLQNGKGKAFVSGGDWYEVEFSYADGVVTAIACDCPVVGACKHMVAALYRLRALLQTAKKEAWGENFTVCNHDCFARAVSRAKGKITLEL